MTVEKDFIVPNEYSRPGRNRADTKGIVFHWVANPNSTPKQNRDFFDNRVLGKTGYGSAHYIIGIKGDVIQCMPDQEVAYHCGATQPVTEKSGQYYTDLARQRFPDYTIDYKHRSPNSILMGIELCHPDWTGVFSYATMEAAKELAFVLAKSYDLDPIKDFFRHYDIVGYKDCPRFWVTHSGEWEMFKSDVARMIKDE